MLSMHWSGWLSNPLSLRLLIVFAVSWALPAIAHAAPVNSPEALLAQAWFTPSLTIDDDPECAQLLSDVKHRFATTQSWRSRQPSNFTRLKRIDPGQADPAGRPVVKEGPMWSFAKSDGTRIYAYVGTHPGCGGACETEFVAISDTWFGTEREASDDKTRTSLAPDWTIYEADTGEHYLVGMVDRNLDVYRVAPSKEFRLSCRIQLSPEKAAASVDADIRAVARSISELRAAAGALSGGNGNCGSMRTASRWAEEAGNALEEALYRPWALSTSTGDRSSENSNGDYPRIARQLDEWSLKGPSEFAIHARYLEQLDRTEQDVGRFYVKKFGWPEKDAVDMAKVALTNAVSVGFGFYRFDPFPTANEAALRRAILKHRPMAEIRSIDFDFTASRDFEGDGLAAIAVGYPDALKYLLDQGADPDERNAFGKTALMSAAQLNQFETAEILLGSGANPLARTIVPDDHCQYTISTEGMTPLHYAVRYASAKLVRLLLGNGASPLISTSGGPHPDGSPEGWLRQYTGSDAGTERNSNITSADATDLMPLLRKPDGPELAKQINALVRQAEAQVAAEKFESAYQTMSAAIAADPGNQRALADLPLVSLKASRIPEAAAAADAATTRLVSPSGKATAWFNGKRQLKYALSAAPAVSKENLDVADRKSPSIRDRFPSA